MCRISSRYPSPPYQTISSKSRCCVLPYVSFHPRSPRATIRVKVTVAPFPRDLKIGHDPSLGAPMPGITAPRRGRTVGQNPVRFALLAPVTGSQTPNCSLPSLSPRAVQAIYSFALCGERWSNNVSVCKLPGSSSEALYCTSPARRYNDRSSASHPNAPSH
jgi:hypothetical protein